MTIQDGDINKHLDLPPKKDYNFIIALVLIIIVIGILGSYLIKPEIYDFILKPEDKTEEKKPKEKTIYSDKLELNNIKKEEATKYYDIAHELTKYLDDREYFFTNEMDNSGWFSPSTESRQDFAMWFVLEKEYENLEKFSTEGEDISNLPPRLLVDTTHYDISTKKISKTEYETLYRKYFTSDYAFVTTNNIEYRDCYLLSYNESKEEFIVYTNKTKCTKKNIKNSYILEKAEIIDDYMYLYESNGDDEFMYTLKKESDGYKFVLRTFNSSKKIKIK